MGAVLARVFLQWGDVRHMGKNRRRMAARMACFAIFILMGVMLRVAPAFAETLDVSGIDSMCTTQDQKSSVDILTVTGNKGDTIYIRMKKGDQIIADHLAFTLDETTAQADENNDMVGAVSVEFNTEAFSYNDTYTIEVFADRNQTSSKYEGTVSTVFAKCGDREPEALAVRTIGSKDKDRPFEAPQTMQDSDGVAYKLASNTPVSENGKQVYKYELAQDELKESVDAHITYLDQDNPTGTPIKVDAITLAKNSTQSIDVQSIVSANDGTMYRALTLADKLTVSYPGTTEYSILCKKLSSEWGKVGSFYKASIKYVGTDGKSLGVVDSVIVNKSYTYTAPDRLYVDDSGTVRQYEIQNKADAVLKLNPGDAEGSKVYEIAYVPIADDAPRTWTVVVENGSVDPKDPRRVLERKDYTGEPGKTAKHTTEAKIAKDGVDYVPAASTLDSYEHTFSAATMDVEQTIYYVPDGYVAPEAYQLTVNYVNIATGEVIDAQSYTASPTMRGDLEITSPESFSKNGVEWVRLTGQEAALRHGFYSPNRTYTIYYRDINDDLHATTIIRNTRVVYVNEQGETVTRPTTIVNNGTTTTDEGTTQTDGGTTEGTAEGTAGGGEAATATGGTVDTGLQTGTDLRSIDGQDGQQIVGADGTDTATTRIEDEETPLAQSASQNAAGKIDPKIVAIGGGIAAAAVAAALVLFFVFKRRKKNAEDATDEDLTA